MSVFRSASLALAVAVSLTLAPVRAQEIKAEPYSFAAGMVSTHLAINLKSAVVANIKGNSASVTKNFDYSKKMAAWLKVELKPLPAPKDAPAGIQYLRNERARLAEAISKKRNKQIGSTFSVIFTNSILNAAHGLNATTFNAEAVKVLRKEGPASGLPERFWKPVADLVENDADTDAVNAAITKQTAGMLAWFNKGMKKQ